MKLRTLLPVSGLLVALMSPEDAAQFNRTAVSINGNDANLCSVNSPCRSFARAISQTNAGGEVIALDSGGYGSFTVDRGLTVMAAPGVYAGITATSTDAIVISATALSRVVLRNLFVNTPHVASSGVFVSGPVAGVTIEQLVIDGFANWGILSFGNVVISDTTIRNSGIGIQIDNAGAAVSATIEHVKLSDMGGGTGSTGRGLLVMRNANVTIRDSVATFMPFGFDAQNNGVLAVENCVVTHNNVGIESTDSATVRVSNTVATHNMTGLANSNFPTSSFYSYGNNKVAGNTLNDTAGPIGLISQY